MRTIRFITCDVFTTERFTGNQLAVVFGAEGLPTATLQAITREFNFAETTFVFAPEDPSHTRRVRIFTPELELPFAGHPTIGTAHVLVASGEVPAVGNEMTLVLGENVGPVPVRVTLENGVPVHAQLTTAQLPEERVEVTDLDALANVLSLSASDLVGGAHAPTGVSCGVAFQVIALNSVEAVKRARLNTDAWDAVLKDTWASWPMVFAMSRESGADRDADRDALLPAHVRGCDIRARVFVPGSTVPEDPATGSANACLAGYLAKRTPRDGLLKWEVAQGVEMGRPSRLHIEAHKSGSVIDAVRVGGATVLVSEGTMAVR
ncbi:PhzF family phenazine biosynthesis protein [Gemmatimonas sp.]|uniref:PhzF family phenazine biosynthesis protein n=1 Tax=Gemmatimonas sp. TaxID=1962908 RepID=UPI003563BEA4